MAVEEDAEHAEREQDRGDGQIVRRGRSQLHPLAHSRVGMLRPRPAGRRAICFETFCGRVSPRLRWVSTIAPIIATSRIRPGDLEQEQVAAVEQLPERDDVGLGGVGDMRGR